MPGKLDLRGILIDVDGVLYTANQLIPGAVDTVSWLQTRGIPHLFVTNTTSKTRAALLESLLSFGIQAALPEILTPPVAAAEWLRRNGKGKVALFVRSSAREEFQDLLLLPDDAECGAAYVVIGDLGELWDYSTLNRAFRLLYNNPDAKLLALGMTRYWVAPGGLSLDVAPFVAALEHAAGRKALVFGKPAAAFFRAAARMLGIPAKHVLMMGDDIHADVGGAQSAGLHGALVKTGKFRSADLAGKIRPGVVFDSIADLPHWWDTEFGRPHI